MRVVVLVLVALSEGPVEFAGAFDSELLLSVGAVVVFVVVSLGVGAESFMASAANAEKASFFSWLAFESEFGWAFDGDGA